MKSVIKNSVTDTLITANESQQDDFANPNMDYHNLTDNQFNLPTLRGH